jgi:hypothetical protein
MSEISEVLSNNPTVIKWWIGDMVLWAQLDGGYVTSGSADGLHAAIAELPEAMLRGYIPAIRSAGSRVTSDEMVALWVNREVHTAAVLLMEQVNDLLSQQLRTDAQALSKEDQEKLAQLREELMIQEVRAAIVNRHLVATS